MNKKIYNKIKGYSIKDKGYALVVKRIKNIDPIAKTAVVDVAIKNGQLQYPTTALIAWDDDHVELIGVDD